MLVGYYYCYYTDVAVTTTTNILELAVGSGISHIVQCHGVLVINGSFE